MTKLTIKQIKELNEVIRERDNLKADLRKLSEIRHAKIAWERGSPSWYESVHLTEEMLANIRGLYRDKILEIGKKLEEMGVEIFTGNKDD